MVQIKTLLPELRNLVGELAEDLLARSTSDAKINAGLKEAFQQIEKGGRTAQAFEVWREDYLDQVAVAWVLACVFVRFMEDNGLIDECWLAGVGERCRLAEDTHELFFRKNPHDTDREYFQHVFKEVGQIPAAKDLFAEGKTPLWAVPPSGDAAMKLLKFWREIDPESGKLKRSFNHEIHESHERETKSDSSSFRAFSVFRGSDPTRFLGDLYQELSERAKKKFALLQTPVFVEEFILDRTLTPALAEFGLEKVRMIDPTCGSGHFLLGGFARLFDLWSKPDHTTGNAEKDAQKALDGVWGVDINPFAVAIARFRLIVAAVQACGIKRLKQAPGWNIHLASGDSLLFGSKPSFGGQRVGIAQQLSLFEVPAIYAVEDRKTLQEILGQGYHVVVGNPPYIIVRDRVQNAAYRQIYSSCHQKFSLGVPFTQRFWELAMQPGEANSGSGYIGMITANSFMKREFGKKLIEEYFPKIDLTHVVDTSGAYIPGHGTPTVILLGRAQKPVGDTVRAILGIKGEPSTPEDPSQGFVWRSIVRQIDIADTKDDFTSTADVPRETFSKHPWSIGGGGVSDVLDFIDENAAQTLSELAESIGITSFTLEDDVYIIPWNVARRFKIKPSELREMVVGDTLRDWLGTRCEPAVFLYESDSFRPFKEDFSLPVFRYLWSYRTNLANSKMFGGKTKVQAGLNWFEHGRLTHTKLRTPLSISLAFVATHNHFVLDRGGKVFNRSAPIIKLLAEAIEDDHLALLGLLNSSAACFWMKQTFHNKGSTVDQHGARQRTAPFEDFYEFTATGLQRFPLPESRPLALSRQLDQLARRFTSNLPESVAELATPTANRIAESRMEATAIWGQMIALQEELDWHCYQLYGLVSDDLRYSGEDLPEMALGQRAFEIVMARQMANGELETTWFERHGSTPITEIPSHWPAAYRKLVERRIKLIETNKEIALIEKPEYKRRWNTEPWEEQEQRALRNWLLDRLETSKYRKGTKDHPELTTTAQMADVASADAEFQQVAALYRGRPDFNMAALVAELVEAEAVPLLPILRYKATGLRKREVWERTWDLQRQQDELARQRSNCDERLRLIHLRIEASFHRERADLEKIESEFRVNCVRARDTYAPKVQFENDWNGSTMLEALSHHGISVEGGTTLDGLLATRKKVWELQSEINAKIRERCDEDAEYKAIQRERESIPPDDPEVAVPPKYATADFLKTDYWRLRGKLDVPKERWVSYPHCSTDSDPTLVVGWAGWNHLEQATALIAYYDARKREGWDAKRLTPLLAGLDQLLPWIHQWHPEIDAEFGETAGQSFQTMLEHDAHELGLTLEDIRNWTPPEKAKKTRTSKKKTTAAEQDDA